MTDTLILFKPLADFGEALKKDCPKNDCIVYRNIYERYCEEYTDYKRIKETFADLSEATIRTLEHAIRASEKDLYAMWFENYAVKEHTRNSAAATKRAIEDFFILIPLSNCKFLRQNSPILTFNTIIRPSCAKIKNKAEYLHTVCK